MRSSWPPSALLALVDGRQGIAHRQGRPHRIGGCLRPRLRHPEQGHHRVADELVHHAAMLDDRSRRLREPLVEQVHDLLWGRFSPTAR